MKFHILLNTPKGWKITKNKIVLFIYKTQKNAIIKAQTEAQKIGGTVVVHGKNGKIRAEYSYAKCFNLLKNKNTRKPNTTRRNKNFSKKIEKKVWEKANIIKGKNPNKIRKDKCGATIHFDQYGNRNSIYGWEIDHIIPVAKNGNDHMDNLQPLHWKNNAFKSDKNECSKYCKIKT